MSVRGGKQRASDKADIGVHSVVARKLPQGPPFQFAGPRDIVAGPEGILLVPRRM